MIRLNRDNRWRRCALLFCTCSVPMLAWANADWPVIRETHGSYIFTDPASAGFSLLIRGKASREPLYKLSCYSGDRDVGEFDYSGLLSCRLISLYSRERINNLLASGAAQTSDWQGRARFMDWHPRCGRETSAKLTAWPQKFAPARYGLIATTFSIRPCHSAATSNRAGAAKWAALHWIFTPKASRSALRFNMSRN